MTSKNRSTLVILAVTFILAFIVLAIAFRDYTEKYAIDEAQKLVQDSLLTHRAIHQYVNKVSRQEIYRLKKEGDLYEDYFSPKTLSFTYTARGIKDFLNKERSKSGLPEVYFKLASNNPRNEINRADEAESQLLKMMNDGLIEDYREVIEEPDGGKYLYIAIPTKPITRGCLRCHGDPDDAPEEMVAMYPKAKGYFEDVGDIRALISIRIPLENHLKDGEQVSNTLTFITFVILSLIYMMIWFFIKHIDQQQQVIFAKNQELEQASVTDFLTNIYNRLGFMKISERLLDSAKRYNKSFSIIMFDLDYFKNVNDQHGHDIGDAVLVELANLVTKRLRQSDVFGRFGGEEFIIASMEQNASGAASLAEELRATIETHEFPEKLNLTASFGVAELAGDVLLSDLISYADKALYESKNAGRNSVSLFSIQ